MKIFVCVKQVPASMEDIELTEEREISNEYLNFYLNEYDEYALEEAVQLKEEFGGEVHVITIGTEDVEETLKLCIAKGAEKAVKIDGNLMEETDTYVKAKILAKFLGNSDFDLIFTGLQSEDESHAQVGVEIAAMLGLPHASLITEFEYSPEESKASVLRELEGGLEERVEIPAPAVFTFQTGINEPRYASTMARRRIGSEKIDVKTLEDLDFDESDMKVLKAMTKLEGLNEPPTAEKANILEGSPEEISSVLVEVLNKRGLVD